MIKKTAVILFIIITIITVISLFTACSEKEPESPVIGDRTYADFAGKKIGVSVGAISDQVAEDYLNATPVYYTDLTAGIEDVILGRIDGFMTNYSTLRIFAELSGGGELECVNVPVEFFRAEVGAVSTDLELLDRFNAMLSELEFDGTLTDMKNRWLGEIPDLDSPMPELKSSGENGILRVAACGDREPFSYMGANGELKGISVELALRFGKREGMIIEFAEMDFGSLIPYVLSGKAELGLANISITEERKKSISFSEPFCEDQLGILALKQKTDGMQDYTNFAGKKIATITGAVCQNTIEKIGGSPVYYSESTGAVEDVRNGRVAGYMTTLSDARLITALPGNGMFKTIEIPGDIFKAEVGGISSNQATIVLFNEFLEAITNDGTLSDMQDRWFGEKLDLNAFIPEIANTGENGVLKVATCVGELPYVYMGANGKLSGFSVELALRFGAYTKKTVDFTEMDFAGLIPYIISGKADISIANMAITEERKKSVLFTEPYAGERHAILTLKQTGDDDIQPEDYTWFEWIKTGIERNLITDNRWKMIVSGLGITLIISLAAQVFGTVTGCFICWLLMRKNKLTRLLGNLYCGLIHGTPVVVLLMITYYIIFGSVKISGVIVAVAAFGLITGANIAVNLKGAIDTVDPVEIEAARSIGFSSFRAFLTVTLPQAVRRALPGYTGGFVELVKSTAIVGYIAIQDLTRAGDIIRSRTYDAYFPLLLVAVIYLIVTTVCVQLFKLALKKVNGGVFR